MARVMVIYTHPGQRFSRANVAMAKAAAGVDDITFVDLYAEYPRHDINVEKEQARLLAHDVIVFQFPVFWYSSPSLLKEWQDLVLQYGFAYGHDGKALVGKTLMLAVTAGGPEDAYRKGGYQQHALRDFLVPFQQTAGLCGMKFAPPFALYGALGAKPEEEIATHASAYAALLTAIRDDACDLEDDGKAVVQASTLSKRIKG
ncbi:MAG: NAD(P)H-dependent oxidoreductase [Pseudomonadota bacterium]